VKDCVYRGARRTRECQQEVERVGEREWGGGGGKKVSYNREEQKWKTVCAQLFNKSCAVIMLR
jgi:hypothetical protein